MENNLKKYHPGFKFKTPADLVAVLEKYFKDTPETEYTITGIALVVGSKQIIYDYEKREDYGDIIRWAQLQVEHSYELAMRRSPNAGNIFALKNFNWTDNQQIQLSGEVGLSFLAAAIKKSKGVGDNDDKNERHGSDVPAGEAKSCKL